jgi:hypothetical protein
MQHTKVTLLQVMPGLFELVQFDGLQHALHKHEDNRAKAARHEKVQFWYHQILQIQMQATRHFVSLFTLMTLSTPCIVCSTTTGSNTAYSDVGG